MEWWMWALAGIALLAVEIATPGGLVALFFAAGAFAAAAAALAGASWTAEWLVFSVVSLASLGFLRRTLLDRLGHRTQVAVDEIVGQEVVVVVEVPPGGEGKAELRGTPWTARASGGVPLRPGQRCTVERVEGVTLWVRAS